MVFFGSHLYPTTNQYEQNIVSNDHYESGSLAVIYTGWDYGFRVRGA
jgi:hypothetical protein